MIISWWLNRYKIFPKYIAHFFIFYVIIGYLPYLARLKMALILRLPTTTVSTTPNQTNLMRGNLCKTVNFSQREMPRNFLILSVIKTCQSKTIVGAHKRAGLKWKREGGSFQNSATFCNLRVFKTTFSTKICTTIRASLVRN